MGTQDNNVEVAEATETVTPATTTAFVDGVEGVTTPDARFTADDIAKARQQEKAKVYGTIEKLQEAVSNFEKREAERAAVEADRAAKRAEREAQRQAEKKAQEEDEMSFKELLKAKEQEFEARLAAEAQEREKAFALLQREREFQELTNYRQTRLEQERENIIPELIDLISGNTPEEIEQSIAGLKERSSKIFDSVAAVSQQTRKEMVGSRVTMPASGPLDNDSEQFSYSSNDINSMSMADYAKNRAKLLGTASNNRGQGLFG
jgi:hypothetical protein